MILNFAQELLLDSFFDIGSLQFDKPKQLLTIEIWIPKRCGIESSCMLHKRKKWYLQKWVLEISGAIDQQITVEPCEKLDRMFVCSGMNIINGELTFRTHDGANIRILVNDSASAAIHATSEFREY